MRILLLVLVFSLQAYADVDADFDLDTLDPAEIPTLAEDIQSQRKVHQKNETPALEDVKSQDTRSDSKVDQKDETSVPQSVKAQGTLPVLESESSDFAETKHQISIPSPGQTRLDFDFKMDPEQVTILFESRDDIGVEVNAIAIGVEVNAIASGEKRDDERPQTSDLSKRLQASMVVKNGLIRFSSVGIPQCALPSNKLKGTCISNITVRWPENRPLTAVEVDGDMIFDKAAELSIADMVDILKYHEMEKERLETLEKILTYQRPISSQEAKELWELFPSLKQKSFKSIALNMTRKEAYEFLANIEENLKKAQSRRLKRFVRSMSELSEYED